MCRHPVVLRRPVPRLRLVFPMRRSHLPRIYCHREMVGWLDIRWLPYPRAYMSLKPRVCMCRL